MLKTRVAKLHDCEDRFIMESYGSGVTELLSVY